MSGFKVILEYVWIDGRNQIRSKTRVQHYLEKGDFQKERYMEWIWNYDGSSTYQASTTHSEMMLYPIQIYPNPLLELKIEKSRTRHTYECYMLLCRTDRFEGSNEESSYMYAKRVFDDERVKREMPWFGLEQEYFFFEPLTELPVGYGVLIDHQVMKRDPPKPQGDYYCGVGGFNMICRNLAERHMMICLEMGIQISGTNAEVAYAQWEFQIGPVEGIEACNQLWIARYVLKRVVEEEGLDVTFEPKPITWGDWNGSGCHTNFSTKSMREEGGIEEIYRSMEKLNKKQKEHIVLYGDGNEMRLTGKNETSDMKNFSYGVGSRNTSVRIGYETRRDGRGYFEDRRPAANMDPYLVCGKLCETILMEE